MLEKPCISIRELLSSSKKNRKKKKVEKIQRNIFEQRLQENSPPPLSVINSPRKKEKKRKRKEKKKGGKFASFLPPLNNPAGKTIVYSLSSTFPHNTLGSRVSVARNSHKSRPRFPLQGQRRASLCRGHSRATILLSSLARSNGRTNRRNKSGRGPATSA